MTGTVEDLPSSQRQVALALVNRLRHDLGKYVSFQARWVGPSASDQELADAVRADLVETRRGPAGVVSARQLWAEIRPALTGQGLLDGEGVDLSLDPAISEIDAALDQIAALSEAWGAGEPVAVRQAAELARAIQGSCAAMLRRVRVGVEG